MSYIPAPLDFVCNTCGRFQKFDSIRDASAGMDELKKDRCDTGLPNQASAAGASSMSSSCTGLVRGLLRRQGDGSGAQPDQEV